MRGLGYLRYHLLILMLICFLPHAQAVKRYRSSTGDHYPAWAFPCRCTEGCNTDTGECLNGGTCILGRPEEYPWSGRACRTGNVAIDKPTRQTGTYLGIYSSNRAVDGNVGPDRRQGYCAHVDTKASDSSDWNSPAWWYVDLQHTYRIEKIVIYNEQLDSNRLLEFHVTIGDYEEPKNNQKIYTHGAVPVSVYDGLVITTGGPWTGRYVGVYKKDQQGFRFYLPLCEVVVIGRKSIDCRNCPSSCEDFNGCSKCPTGRKLPDCIAGCTDSEYGDNCESTCSNHCKSPGTGRYCDVETGACTSRCKDISNVVFSTIWTGDKCDIEICQDVISDQPEIITQTTVTWKWKESTDVSLAAAPYVGYLIQHSKDNNTWYNTSAVLYDTTKGGWQEEKVTGLGPDTQYWFDIIVYRIYNGVKYPSPYTAKGQKQLTARTLKGSTSSVSTTTTTTTTTKPSTTTTTKALTTTTTSKATASTTTTKSPIISITSTLTAGAPTHIAPSLPRTEQSQNPSTLAPPSARNTEAPPTGNDEGGLGIGVIIGAAIGGLILVLLIVIIVVILIRRRKHNPKDGGEETSIRNTARMSLIQLKDKIVSVGKKEKGNKLLSEEVPVRATTNPTLSSSPNGAIYGNRDSMMPDSTAVEVANLEKYINYQKSLDKPYNAEFEAIPKDELLDCKAARTPSNIKKNKYKNIIAYDTTRVVLKSPPEGSTDYINANYITGYGNKAKEYIATQAPLKETKNEFWEMVWEQKSSIIIMLTRQVELAIVKCREYWPEEEGELLEFGEVKVTAVSEETTVDYVTRTFKISKNNQKLNVKHFQFLQWPDKKSPEQPFWLLNFRSWVRSYLPENKGPIIVHCSAGIGRTGTYIAIDSLIQEAQDLGKVDVPRQVNQMRLERMNLVQTRGQYEFLYDTLFDSVKCGETGIPLIKLSSEVPKIKQGKLSKQFNTLQSLKPNKGNNLDGKKKENKDKNRDTELIPNDRHRPYLTTKTPDGNNYINGMIYNGYMREKALITTQHPLPGTVPDFWRLVYDLRCNTIVMLDNINKNDSTMPVYWPDDEEPKQQFGPLEVTMDTTDTQGAIEMREFKIKLLKKPDVTARTVRQYQLLSWGRKDQTPDPQDLLELVDRVGWWKNDAGHGATLVHCYDGVAKSGLYSVASYLLEKMKAEKVADVFLATRHLQLRRPEIINNLEQYGFLYEVALQAAPRMESSYYNMN